MSTTLRSRPAVVAGTVNGGVPARRAVIRWAMRLFRREWRQQLLVFGMLAVAVAATIWGAGVATNTPPPSSATYGTANAMITLPGNDPHLAADIAAIQQKYGPIDVIENRVIASGTTQNIELRAQDPAGRYGHPLLTLNSGHYPNGLGQAALTTQVASLYGLHVGDTWHEDGRAWLVTGIVANPTNLLDEFALVAPGQVTSPDQVTILLDQPVSASQDGAPSGPGGQDRAQALFPGLPAAASVSLPAPSGGLQISPATIVLVITVLGLVFIGLVSVAGFTVIAQRRLRALGMISALGATERNVRLVMTANGAAVGVTAAMVGAIAGFGAWFAYVPALQSATGHRVDPLNLPWWAIAAGVLLAVVTSVLAARRPARIAARIPVVAALSGRPAEPKPRGLGDRHPPVKRLHRSALPGLLLIGGGIVCLLFSGGWGGNSGSDSLFLLAGLVAIIIGIFLFAPLCVTLLSVAAGTRVPVSVRIALRDLVRYRARSGAALAATTFAVFLAMLICIVASVRLSGKLNALDYSGPNLTSSQLIVHAGPPHTDRNALNKQVDTFAASVHATSVLALETVNATLQEQGVGNNNFSGTLYVATPALLAEYGIKHVHPAADILTMRPGLASQPNMQLLYGDLGEQANPSVLNNPEIDTVSSLPSGTSAPNTVITMHAVDTLHLHVSVDSWLITTPRPLTTTQISAARQMARANSTTVESKSGELALGQISDGATALGLIIAVGVLAMTVGLVRSETARDLRTLTATGAAATTRRTITAVTAGALALLGAVMGTAGAAMVGLAWAHSSLSDTFGNVPLLDYLLVLIGLPAIAVIGGWLLAGRQPAVIARQPLE
jgi:putative ABC transport system permease protein